MGHSPYSFTAFLCSAFSEYMDMEADVLHLRAKLCMHYQSSRPRSKVFTAKTCCCSTVVEPSHEHHASNDVDPPESESIMEVSTSHRPSTERLLCASLVGGATTAVCQSIDARSKLHEGAAGSGPAIIARSCLAKQQIHVEHGKPKLLQQSTPRCLLHWRNQP